MRQKQKISMNRIVNALADQLIYVDANEISLVYRDGYLIKVVMRNGAVISLDAETLQIYNIETPSDAVHRIAVMMLDRDE